MNKKTAGLYIVQVQPGAACAIKEEMEVVTFLREGLAGGLNRGPPAVTGQRQMHTPESLTHPRFRLGSPRLATAAPLATLLYAFYLERIVDPAARIDLPKQLSEFSFAITIPAASAAAAVCT